MRIIRAKIYGTPVPQGSKRAFHHPRTGKIIMVDQQKGLRSWRQDVAAKLAAEWKGEPSDQAIELDVMFYFRRPKGHYGKKGLRPSAPEQKTTRPDVDKLARAILDAATGIVYRDDSQVVRLTASKRFSDTDMAVIWIDEVPQ